MGLFGLQHQSRRGRARHTARQVQAGASARPGTM